MHNYANNLLLEQVGQELTLQSTHELNLRLANFGAFLCYTPVSTPLDRNRLES